LEKGAKDPNPMGHLRPKLHGKQEFPHVPYPLTTFTPLDFPIPREWKQ